MDLGRLQQQVDSLQATLHCPLWCVRACGVNGEPRIELASY